jgi:hypothetical protein
MTEAAQHRQHRLHGLEPDNLLAFLALLGLLRALDTARPDWRARAWWDIETPPLRPVLALAAPQSEAAISAAAAEGIAVWGMQLRKLVEVAHSLDNESSTETERRTDLTSSAAAFRAVARNDLSDAQALLFASLCCEGVQRKRGDRVDSEFSCFSTDLKFSSGQMAFVGTMLALTSGDVSVEDVRRSLFGTWTYRLKGRSLRLSPVEAKRYALQATDPGPLGAWSEAGASALAVLGFPSLPMVPAREAVSTTAIAKREAKSHIRWPIWESRSHRGWSLPAIEAVLRHPSLFRSKSDDIWKLPSAMLWVMEAEIFRLNDGYYKNVTPGNVVLSGATFLDV